MTHSLPPRRSPLFQSVRSSRDVSLVAFAGALLAAFALHAGAFLPKLAPRDAVAPLVAVERAPEPQPPAIVAAGARATVPASPGEPAPCETPRG